MKKTSPKKLHPMAHTHRQTHGHGDSMTDPAQRAESVKNTLCLYNNALNILWTPNTFKDSKSQGAGLSGSVKISGIKSILSVILQFEQSESFFDTHSLFMGL